MWPFKKKKLYKLTWAYGSEYARNVEMYTEYIRATDVADVWRKHRKERAIPTFCVSLEVINENGNSQII